MNKYKNKCKALISNFNLLDCVFRTACYLPALEKSLYTVFSMPFIFEIRASALAQPLNLDTSASTPWQSTPGPLDTYNFVYTVQYYHYNIQRLFPLWLCLQVVEKLMISYLLLKGIRGVNYICSNVSSLVWLKAATPVPRFKTCEHVLSEKNSL